MVITTYYIRDSPDCRSSWLLLKWRKGTVSGPPRLLSKAGEWVADSRNVWRRGHALRIRAGGPSGTVDHGRPRVWPDNPTPNAFGIPQGGDTRPRRAGAITPRTSSARRLPGCTNHHPGAATPSQRRQLASRHHRSPASTGCGGSILGLDCWARSIRWVTSLDPLARPIYPPLRPKTAAHYQFDRFIISFGKPASSHTLYCLTTSRRLQ